MRFSARPLHAAIWALNLCFLAFPASASPDQAQAAITDCLRGKVGERQAKTCVGRYGDACALRASDTAPMARLEVGTQCLVDAKTAWDRLTDRAIASWRSSDVTGWPDAMQSAADQNKVYRAVKCAVFQNTAQFGATGMMLEAGCLRDEAANIAIMLGYGLD